MDEKSNSNKPARCAILLPLKPEQLETLKAAALADELPTATWVRLAALKAARATLKASKPK